MSSSSSSSSSLQLVRQVLSQNTTDKWAEEWLARTLNVLDKHRRDFANVARRFPTGGDVKRHFTDVVRALLVDGIVSSPRIITTMAFATYLQEIYGIDLKDATASLVEETLFNHILRHCVNDYCGDVPDSFHLLEWPLCDVLTLLHDVIDYA